MTLFEFDEATELSYGTPLCGTDEAGRGPLAGPVFAAAVILPRGVEIKGLNDSKKLSAARREALFDEIVAKSLACAVASVGEEDIDNLNILNASMAAMTMAVEELDLAPTAVLVDGNRSPKLTCRAVPIVGGDGKSACIAAASILAKVSRDRYMEELALLYPEYGFEQHKGYPTRLHYERILAYGISPVHRVTFLKNIEEKRREFEGKGSIR